MAEFCYFVEDGIPCIHLCDRGMYMHKRFEIVAMFDVNMRASYVRIHILIYLNISPTYEHV